VNWGATAVRPSGTLTKAIGEAWARRTLRVSAYGLMPNHAGPRFRSRPTRAEIPSGGNGKRQSEENQECTREGAEVGVDQ
jgi:hypothetical protein